MDNCRKAEFAEMRFIACCNDYSRALKNNRFPTFYDGIIFEPARVWQVKNTIIPFLIKILFLLFQNLRNH
jgi:hypothetical protein